MPGTLLAGSSLAHGLTASGFQGFGPVRTRKLADGRTLLYLLRWGSGPVVRVYDVTGPTAPVLLGTSPNPPSPSYLDGGRAAGKFTPDSAPRYMGTDTQYRGSGSSGGISGFDLGAASSPDSTPDHISSLGTSWGQSSGGFTAPGDQRGEVHAWINVSGFVQIGNVQWLNVRTGATGSFQVSREGAAGGFYSGHPSMMVAHPDQAYGYSWNINDNQGTGNKHRIYTWSDGAGIAFHSYLGAALVALNTDRWFGVAGAGYQRVFVHGSPGSFPELHTIDVSSPLAPAALATVQFGNSGEFVATAGASGGQLVIANRYLCVMTTQGATHRLRLVDLVSRALVDSYDVSLAGVAGSPQHYFVTAGGLLGLVTSSHVYLFNGVALPTGWTVGARLA